MQMDDITANEIWSLQIGENDDENVENNDDDDDDNDDNRGKLRNVIKEIKQECPVVESCKLNEITTNVIR